MQDELQQLPAAWLVLPAAGLPEVVCSVSMKASEGITRPALTAISGSWRRLGASSGRME